VLPPTGSQARRDLDTEALRTARQMLDEHCNEIAGALWGTFMSLRMRFLEERGLNQAMEPGEEWADAITDARVLTAFVNDLWASAIRRRFATEALGE